MHSYGDPITLGKVTDVLCIKQDRYKNYLGIEIDYDAGYLSDEANCWVRGLVTRIQAVFVDKYARTEGLTRYVDDSNNEFFVADTDYIDGCEECDNYGHRDASDVCDYIVTLENVVERE